MILMYHKVDIITPTIWWVTPEDLERHIVTLRNRNFVYLDDYRNPEKDVVITFDDAYENVFHHALPVLQAKSVPFEVFVVGKFIDGWNDFDPGEPRTRHMSLEQLIRIANSGGRIQWHTRSHPNLLELEEREIVKEMTVPEELRQEFPDPHFSWFSYPGGAHGSKSIEIARKLYSGAVSVIDGLPGDQWQINRITVDRFTNFDSPWLNQLNN